MSRSSPLRVGIGTRSDPQKSKCEAILAYVESDGDSSNMAHRKFSEITGDISTERRARIDVIKETYRRQPQSEHEIGRSDAATAEMSADEP